MTPCGWPRATPPSPTTSSRGGCSTRRCCAARTPTPASCASTTRRPRALPGVRAVLHHGNTPRVKYASGGQSWPNPHPYDPGELRRQGAPRRRPRRCRGRGHHRNRARRRCGSSKSTTRCSPPCSTSARPWAPTLPRVHDEDDTTHICDPAAQPRAPHHRRARRRGRQHRRRSRTFLSRPSGCTRCSSAPSSPTSRWRGSTPTSEWWCAPPPRCRSTPAGCWPRSSVWRSRTSG